MTDKWKKVKETGSKHYKQGSDKIEPIDLYKDGGFLRDFIVGSIIKYAYRNRTAANKIDGLVRDMEKIKHYCDFLIADEEDGKRLEPGPPGGVLAVASTLIATPPCPKQGKKGHKTYEDKGLFYQCECGFCWWKDQTEVDKDEKL